VVYATLRPAEGTGTLVVDLRTGEMPATGVELLLPDRPPEQDMGSGRGGGSVPRVEVSVDAEPQQVDGTVSATYDVATRTTDRQRIDEATGVRLRVVREIDLPADPAQVQLRVVADEPVRVAVAVGIDHADDELALAEAHATPRTVARLRQWYDLPADGSAQQPASVGAAAAGEVDYRYALFGAVLTAAMVLLAGWWVVSGRLDSRVRGLSRHGIGPGSKSSPPPPPPRTPR
jgi:hypothetical protein